jgi:hypothetical protein
MLIYFYENRILKNLELPVYCNKIIHLKNNILNNSNYNNYSFSNLKITYIENGIYIIPDNESYLNEHLDYYLNFI